MTAYNNAAIAPPDRICAALSHAQAVLQLLQNAVNAGDGAALVDVDIELDDLDQVLDDLRGFPGNWAPPGRQG